ncbi:MAG: class I SAM-dependent methyltransferase [Polyangiales bacterium]
MSDSYLLDVGEDAADRLTLVQAIYGQTSQRGLSAGAPLAGLRVLELACGTGSMTRWLAEQVGPSGSVTGIDASDAQLSVAAERCRDLPNVRFLRMDAADTDLPPSSFDLVYARLLLMHVPEPLRVLLHAHELLAPGGVLVSEEAAVDSTFTDPPVPEQGELHALANQMARERGCDYNVARRLGSLVRAAGFTVHGVSAHQPVAVRGAAKRLEVASFGEALQHWRTASDETRAAGERVLAALQRAVDDDETTYGLSMMMQVRGEKARA